MTVAIDAKSIVHLRGGMQQLSGANNHAFVLPAAFRPNRSVYVVANLASTYTGRLRIDPDGQVTVDAPDYSRARILTSLDHISYAKN